MPDFQLFGFFECVCALCVPMCMCAPVCAHLCVCVEARDQHWLSPLVVLHFALRQRLSLNSNFARLSRLADPQVLGILLSLSSSAGIGFFSGFLVFGWQALY